MKWLMLMLLPFALLLGGCFSAAATDTRYDRKDKGADWNGPETRDASTEKTERVTVRRGSSPLYTVTENADGTYTIERMH